MSDELERAVSTALAQTPREHLRQARLFADRIRLALGAPPRGVLDGPIQCGCSCPCRNGVFKVGARCSECASGIHSPHNLQVTP